MQPIKTTNAMNPAPAKGIESFPTPIIDDVVIAEVVNAWKGDYQPLEYGTLWKDVSHAPNQGSFPEHKLVFQQPTSEDGQWIKRIWVNDRVNQDSYNYAIKYSAGSQQHPIYIRNYVVPRETYTPLPDGTPDPLFPIALLVDEEANRIEGELDSKYVSVTRVYETLPGPEVPTKRYNERGDLETVIVQTVPPFTPPDPDGLLVTQSQVVQEEMGKGVKTTATVTDHALLQIKEKKEGLLGETITTDDIVDPSTNPDALSQTVVSSVVEQFSATKARKRTTTASGPTSLSQKSKDGKLLGDVTSTQSIVAPTENPDAVSSSILSSEIKQIDSGKAVKTNVVLNSTPILLGNQNELGLLGNKQVVESIVPAGSAADALSQTIVSSVVEAIDSVRSKKTTITSTGPTTLLGNQKKEGLLGEVNVVETIVSAGTSADALSQTIVSSQVDPIDSAKSKKTTVTSSGPTSLPSDSLVDSPLGLVEAHIEKQIVSTTTKPSSDSNTNFLRVKDSISPIDSAKSERETVDVSTWPENVSVVGDEVIDIPIFYKETIKSPEEYASNDPINGYDKFSGSYDIKALDQWKGLLRKVDTDRFNESIVDKWYKLPAQVDINLPDILLGAKIYWGRSYGDGGDYDFGVGAFTGSYNRNQSGSSKSSYSINGDINFEIQKGFNGAIPGFIHVFFMDAKGLNFGGILNRLNELEASVSLSPVVYSNWPYLQLKSENLVIIGGSKSRTESKSLSESVTINGYSSSNGAGKSFDVNVSVSTLKVPESLHSQINIQEEFIGYAPFNNELSIQNAVRPLVLPESKAVLDGANISCPRFPIGNYLVSATSELYKYGWAKITAKTANITANYTSA